MKDWKSSSKIANTMLFEWFLPLRYMLMDIYKKRLVRLEGINSVRQQFYKGEQV